MRRRGDPWFKFYPQDWLDGTRELSLEQRGAYIDMIAMQMVYEAPVKDDYKWLAHQMHVSSRKAQSIVEGLIDAMKISRSEDGLSNVRASFEIESRANQRRTNAETATNRERNKYEKSETDSKNNVNDENSCNEQSTTCARVDTDTELDKNNILSEPSVSDGGKSSKRKPYSADFEEFWKAYPETRGMSKSRAWMRWQALTSEERYAAAAALPAFKSLLIERRKTNPTLTTLHAEGYISQRRFETLLEAQADAPGVWWKDPDKLSKVTDAKWREGISKFANGIWPMDKLGPAPGNPKCVVPRELIAEMKLDEIYDARGIKRCK